MSAYLWANVVIAALCALARIVLISLAKYPRTMVVGAGVDLASLMTYMGMLAWGLFLIVGGA